MALDESSYDRLVAQTFRRMMATLDAADPDVLETDATADMITITSAQGEKCIINTQRAVHQIWVAGLGQGIHFDWDADAGLWKDDKGVGLELFAHVEHVLSDLSGAPFSFQD